MNVPTYAATAIFTEGCLWCIDAVFDKTKRLKELSPLQYAVTQNNKTERAFANEFWNNKKHGIYVDIVSGKPLFSSTNKYKSGTGWPSFTQPIKNGTLIYTPERSWFGATQIELKSKVARSHLGHVFNDGPKPYGKRYCINSAALKFIPLHAMQQQGYGHYLHLFEHQKP